MLGRIGKIILYAVDDKDLVSILEKLGIYQDVVAGKLQCYFCGRAISMRNLGGIFKHGGQIAAKRVAMPRAPLLADQAVL